MYVSGNNTCIYMYVMAMAVTKLVMAVIGLGYLTSSPNKIHKLITLTRAIHNLSHNQQTQNVLD